MSIVDELDLDPKNFDWRELASCRFLDPSMCNIFFDDYEADQVTARETDNLCLSCPVMQQCLEDGLKGKEEGVWGGVYLVNGKVDRSRNRHKDDETWKRLKQLHGRTLKV